MPNLESFIGRACYANGDYGYITGIAPDVGVVVCLYDGPPPDP